MATAYRRVAARPGSAVVLDVAVATAVLGASFALVIHGTSSVARPGSGDLELVGVLLVVLAAVPLVAWRRVPFGVFALTASASALLAALGYSVGLALGAAVSLYLLAASRDERRPWSRRHTAAVVGLFVAYLGATAAAKATLPATELFHTGLAWAVAWFAGERSRLRREHIAELQERAARAEREAERERLLAAAEERARIARDLHDSAGHAINVMAVRAGAARLRHHQHPDRSLLALEAIEEVARQTAEEIEQIVGTLRDGDSGNGSVEAPPGLASLDALIAEHAATGLAVTFHATGVPRPLGGLVDQAAYRILQEALTNAARHGTGTARIELEFADTAFEVTVTNPVLAGGSRRVSGGHGLVGMRERTTLLGGNLDAEQVNGAFRVHARIPHGSQGA